MWQIAKDVGRCMKRYFDGADPSAEFHYEPSKLDSPGDKRISLPPMDQLLNEDHPDWPYVADVVDLRRAQTSEEIITLMRRAPSPPEH
jgi:hypothetical protein